MDKLTTIYIGGGTPSILSVQMFDKLMASVRSSFDVGTVEELTIEVNPGTLTKSLAQSYVNNGVNRVSMGGLQSTDDKTLKELGRIHSYSQFVETYGILQEVGINNISIDLMFGLSGQTMDGWLKTLSEVIKLNPKHISAYSLIIEEGTLYEEKYDKGELSLPDEDLEREMFWFTHKVLEKAGYKHYEISNYAIEGFESKHNRSYWELVPYIGVGLGASSYYNSVRYKNIDNLSTYIEAKGDWSIIRNEEQTNTLETEVEELFFSWSTKIGRAEFASIG